MDFTRIFKQIDTSHIPIKKLTLLLHYDTQLFFVYSSEWHTIHSLAIKQGDGSCAGTN